MKTTQEHWQVKTRSQTFEVEISADTVTVRSWLNIGRNHNTGICTPQEFLAGKFHDWICRNMSEQTLAMILDQVRHYARYRSPDYINEQTNLICDHWRALPQDSTLDTRAQMPDDNALWHVKPDKQATSLSLSDGTWLLLPTREGADARYSWPAIMRPDGKEFKLRRIQGGRAFVYADQFWIVDGHVWQIAMQGAPQVLYSTKSIATRYHLGQSLRITNLLRTGNQLIGTYYTIKHRYTLQPLADLLGEAGYLGIDPIHGLTSWYRYT